jgi:hypothetical protein
MEPNIFALRSFQQFAKRKDGQHAYQQAHESDNPGSVSRLCLVEVLNV